MKKETYIQPTVVKHELLRDITAGKSGYCEDKDRGNGYGFGHGWGGFGGFGRFGRH
jgi:hypothetical protein